MVLLPVLLLAGELRLGAEQGNAMGLKYLGWAGISVAFLLGRDPGRRIL